LKDGITKHSEKLQNEIEMERKTVKKTFCDLKRQADQAEKTIILHQDEIMAALKSTCLLQSLTHVDLSSTVIMW
jgi:sulfur transfer complex TusBCD TusB component (DsrH family)